MLRMWNGTTVNPIGKFQPTLRNPANGKQTNQTVFVVKENFKPLLGIQAIESLDLITFHSVQLVSSEIMGLCQKYRSVFNDKLGTLPGLCSLSLEMDAKPRILPIRRLPFAIKDKFELELERLLRIGVIVQVEEPTDWVSQVTVVTKKSGELRICIDPKPLNDALRREHYRLPLLEDILPSLTDARYFTKVDLSSAFWHVQLDEPSSFLTTFGTPFGRFRWLRLPFGLKVSSEIFQKRLIQAVENLAGVLCIADDVLIHGKTKDDHDRNLEMFLRRCEQLNIKLKQEKIEYCMPEVTFHGHVLTKEGIKPDPGKVEAILNMRPPTDIKEVARFSGMVNYLGAPLNGCATFHCARKICI